MAYCPHCAYSMPMHGKSTDCPNCGRKRVRLQGKLPSFYSNISALEKREKAQGTYLSSFVAGTVIALCSLGCLALGIILRTGMGLLWDLLGLLAAGAAIYCFYELYRNLAIDRNPEKGFIDHLKDLAESRAALETKIAELKHLVSRQNEHSSERAANRLQLVTAALQNRERKLALVNETEFIIESQRKISRIEALAQELVSGNSPGATEHQIDVAFSDLGKWMQAAPHKFHSAAGKKVHQTLERAFSFHSDIREQIEDRLVMRALEEEAGSGETFALDQIHKFLERNRFSDGMGNSELAECVATDEEYLRISTELRLLRDGIKDSLNDSPHIGLEPDGQFN